MLVGVLAVICCAGPLVVAAIAMTALAAWLSYSGYVLIAAATIAVTLGGSLVPPSSSKYARLLHARNSQQGIKT